MNSREKYTQEEDALSGLIKAAHEPPAVPERLEHKIMLEIARRTIIRSRRKAKLGLIASLSGLGMLLAGCIVIILHWFPGHLTFLETAHISKFDNILSEIANLFPSVGQWGGWVVLALLAGSAIGVIYYLNNLFSNTLPE